MHETLEGHGHGAHSEGPLVIPVSITMSILAVLVAAVMLLGHRSHTEKVLLQAQASDQWAYYQAKGIRQREMQSIADLLGILAVQDKGNADALRQQYLGEADRYGSDKDEISEKAKEYENERDLYGRKADRFDAGEGLLEVGLVICSLTLLTKRRLFWIGGSVIAIAGIVAALTAFALR